MASPRLERMAERAAASAAPSRAFDYGFMECGSLVLVAPQNAKARKHLVKRTAGAWHGGSLAVEPRYAPDLSAELCRDGFRVELPDGRIVTAADLRC